jgi:hypothetical protein
MTHQPRCLGTSSAECQSCARRIERTAADWLTTWMVPPVKRPCELRVERQEETTE